MLPEYWPKGKMPTTLDEILATTSRTLPALRERRAMVEREALAAAAPPSFVAALRRPTMAVIAEVKRQSPSAGVIRADLDPIARAELYAQSGAAAISILTDAPYFGGSLDDLRAASQRVRVPLIRKDFILDEVQVLEARAAGAAAVLLIVRALDRPRLTALLRFTRELGMDALVEAHTAAELDVALEAEARVVGVNSRNLDNFQVDTAGAWALLARMPADVIAVAESGMATVADVTAAAAGGADAALVGTALSAASEPGPLLAAMAGVPRRGR